MGRAAIGGVTPAQPDRWAWTLLLGLFLVAYIVPLPSRPLFLPDEYRYAEIPREMLASGDWIVPRMDGLLYFEKPVLGYWLTAASLRMFGENRFAVRLPSALAIGLTACVTLALAAFSTRRRETAWLSALIFLSSVGAAACGIVAVLDGLLTAFLAATNVSFFVAATAERRSGRERAWLLLAGVCAGLAFLTKGFVALVVPALTAGTYLLWQRRAADLARMAWLPLAAATAIVLPWSVSIHLREPSFWPQFFWHEHVHRFVAENAQHAEPAWFYLAIAPLIILPWSFAAPAALASLRERARTELRDPIRFCLCWIAGPLVFFSTSSGKLASYIVPLLPPAAVLLALGLAAPRPPAATRALKRGLAAGAVAFALAALALAIVRSAPDPRWPAALALALVSATLARAAYRGPSTRHLGAIGLSAGALVVAVAFTLPAEVLGAKSPEELLRTQSDLATVPLVLSDPQTARAVSWSLRRTDVILLGRGEFAFGLDHDPRPDRAVDVPGAARLIRENPGRVALVTLSSRYARFKSELPAPTAETSSGASGYTIARY
jgi:4-amino-4-deoxy-L-arabinose transferase